MLYTSSYNISSNSTVSHSININIVELQLVHQEHGERQGSCWGDVNDSRSRSAV